MPRYEPLEQAMQPPDMIPDDTMDLTGAAVPVVMLGLMPAQIVAFNDTLIRYRVPTVLPAGYVTVVVRTTRGVAVWEGPGYDRRTGIVSGYVRIGTVIHGVEVPQGPWAGGTSAMQHRAIDTRYSDSRGLMQFPYWTVPTGHRTISAEGGAVIAIHGVGFGRTMPAEGLEMMIVDPSARKAALASASNARGLLPESQPSGHWEEAGRPGSPCSGGAEAALGPAMVTPTMAVAIAAMSDLWNNSNFNSSAWDILEPGIAAAVAAPGELPSRSV